MSHAGPTSEHGPLAQVETATTPQPGSVVPPKAGAAAMTVVVGFAGLIASLVVLGTVAEGVRTQEVFALDTWATPSLHGIASPALDAVMQTLTAIGSSLVILPGLALVVAWLIRQRRYGALLFMSVATGGSLVLQATMKLFFQRPRQQLDWAQVLPDYSFPSGHTLNAVVFYVALALILWAVFGRRVGVTALVVAVVLALGVGISRIYLGYHYLTDVLGAILAGIAWLLVVGAAFRARPTWWRWGAAEAVRATLDGSTPGARRRTPKGKKCPR
jgi:undecaprenyl-diphosphatase